MPPKGGKAPANPEATGYMLRGFFEALRRHIRPGVNCLVKGSRSMEMESVVEALAEESGMREAS